ncbi:unnamed protein product [Hymenolepis diminuta]|uniref:Uncharacterized protein n=1 Tax=Hymenolepis diminuta TaxID=6216 RepID=A0A0R3SQ70_HYMDI|nr:unnamed protein product [Hymenolepis diminuta]
MEALLDPRICEIPRPGKKPLFTSGSLPQPPTSIQNECLTPILSLVENTLFIWNNWFVSLPPSLLSADLEKPYDAPNAGELFVHQDFNEYRVLAKDERQRSRRLNNQQLSQLRNYGRFDIESRDFPGYHHSWHISKGLQKGRNLCRAMEFLVIGSKNRFVGDYFSAKVAVFAFADFFQTLLGKYLICNAFDVVIVLSFYLCACVLNLNENDNTELI